MLKKEENPPVVWPKNIKIANFKGEWWVAQTKARNEKAMAWQLVYENVPYFLPMIPKVSKQSGRTFTSIIPLFPNYIFFCGGKNERLKALKTRRTVAILSAADQTQLVHELTAIETILKHGKAILLSDYSSVGDRCRVVAGKLTGIEGKIVQTANKARLILPLELIKQAISVEITCNMVEKL